MATLSALATSISKRLLDTQNTAVSAVDIKTSINSAIEYYKHYRFWFNEKKVDITLTSGSFEVTNMPSDVIQLLPQSGIVLIDNNVRYPLYKVSPELFDLENNDGSGRPYIYTYRNGLWYVYYKPEKDYTTEIRYIQDYTDFATDGSEDSTSNDFTNNAELLITYNALSRLHGELRQDPKMELYYTSRGDNELGNLLRRTYKRTSSGNLTIETIF